MGDVEFIVRRLSEPPFERKMTLVDFDEKVGDDLLQLVMDIFAKLDERNKTSVRDVDREALASTIINFLDLLKFNFKQVNVEDMRNGLMAADKRSVREIIYWTLAKFDKHKKRAYVARFLAPLSIPPEFMHDESVQDIMQEYNALRAQFTEVHRELEAKRESYTSPAELKKEISQLSNEKDQLEAKIEALKRKTKDLNGFSELLEVTSALRKAQEEEASLQNRIHEQNAAFSAAERRYAEESRRVANMRASMDEGASPRQLLERLEREVEENRAVVTKTLPGQIEKREAQLRELRELLDAPARSEDDVMALRRHVEDVERDIDELHGAIQSAQERAGDKNLAQFRSKAAAVQRKVQEQEAALDAAKAENDALRRQLADKEARLAEMAGPAFMGDAEIRQYATQLRAKTEKYKELKRKLTAVQGEVVVLQRTEQVLRARDDNIKDFVAKLEEKRGVRGYTDVHKELQQVSEVKAKTDHAKGQTLEEISRIVESINRTLQDKKAKLAPQIQELRELRARYQEVEARHRDAKSVYDNTAVGLEAERQRLEEQCNEQQSKTLQLESRYHFVHCLKQVNEAQRQRVALERRCQRGEETLLRDNFPTHRDLFQHKVQQLEGMVKELRHKKADLRDNGETHARQRQMFAQLQRLLQAKLHSVRAVQEEAKQEDDAGTLLADADTIGVGGTNVMTLS